MGFFSDVLGGLKAGANYGKAAKIAQNIFGRNLSLSERDLIQKYCQAMNFRADLDPNEIALDFFAFLLTDEPHPSNMIPPALNQSKKNALKQAIIDGIKRNAIAIQDDDKQSLIKWIEGM
jgi:hypothetical protein